MMRPRRLSSIFTLAALSAMALPQTGIGQDNLVTGDDITTINAGTPASDDGQITYTITRDMTDWNVTSAKGNNAVVRTVTLPIVATAFITEPDFTLELNNELLVSAEVTSTSPQVVVYTIQDDAVWSDGTPITGDDFIYIWQTQNGRDCPDCLINAHDGYDLVSGIEQNETGKVVTVTFSEPFVAWQGLFMYMFPAHLAKQHGSLAESYNDFFSLQVPTWSAGPYIVQSFDPGQLVTLVPNPQWYGEKPHLSQLRFRIITDPSQQITALENGEVDVIYPQGATQDLVQQTAGLAYLDISFQMNPAANWYFAGINLQDPVLQNEALRKAIFTAIDIGDMKTKTVDPFLPNWPVMESVMFLPTQTGYNDITSSLGYGTGDVEKARQILTDAGYTIADGALTDPDGTLVPSLKLVYPAGVPIFDDFSVLMTAYLSQLGLKTDLITGPNTTSEYVLAGNYSLMLNYFSQTVYPATKAAQLWTTGASQNYGKYSDPEVDALINQAQGAPDMESSAEYLSQADQMIQEAAYVLPIFQLPTALIYKNNIVNLRDNPNQVGPAYNTAEWGLK